MEVIGTYMYHKAMMGNLIIAYKCMCAFWKFMCYLVFNLIISLVSDRPQDIIRAGADLFIITFFQIVS